MVLLAPKAIVEKWAHPVRLECEVKRVWPGRPVRWAPRATLAKQGRRGQLAKEVSRGPLVIRFCWRSM